MFQKLCLSTCLLFSLWTGAFAQGKPELVLKGGSSDAVASKPDASLAPRAILARPPQSGKEPMLLLGPKNRPYTEQVKHTDKLEYFDWAERFVHAMGKTSSTLEAVVSAEIEGARLKVGSRMTAVV